MATNMGSVTMWEGYMHNQGMRRLKRDFTDWGVRQFTEADVAYKAAIIELTERNPDAIVVDCGCGDGNNTLLLTKRICARELWGIEADKDVARQAETKGIRVWLANLNGHFPLASNTVDVVVANQVIEHLQDTDLFMAEIWRILKPGGYAIICTENLASWHNLFSLLLGWQPFSLSNVSGKVAGLGNPLALHHAEEPGVVWMQHLRVFAYNGLIHLSILHGFAVEAVRGAGYYPLPSKLAARMAIFDPRHAPFLALKLRKPL
jgi:SAM-dependent methyltransferase